MKKKGLLTLAILLASVSCVHAEELRILAWEGYATPEDIEEFKALVNNKFGVNLVVKVSYPATPQDLFDGVRSKDFDIISPANNIPKSERWSLIENNLVLPLNLDNIPNYKNIIPSLQYADYITENGRVYGAPIVYGYYGLAYNADKVKEPKSWSVLWDASNSLKYTISADYSEANVYITALSLGYDNKQIFDLELLRSNPRFEERLTQLATNANSLWIGVDTTKHLKDLSYATAWGFSFPHLKEIGQDWKMANPKEGTTGWIDNWMIGYSLQYNPKMKRIAEEWINFCLSNKVQLGYVKNIAQFPVSLAIKGQLTQQEQSYFHMNDPDFLMKNIILWQPLSKREQNGFKAMWNRARNTAGK